jgi:hypothetical protein
VTPKAVYVVDALVVKSRFKLFLAHMAMFGVPAASV